VLFRNIRELPDASLENTDESWKLIIDFPFDEPGHGPRDDLSRLQAFAQSHREGARTLCWLPSFLSTEAQKDLGMLVILEHILTGERFSQYANHLSPQDRPVAKSLLENQRTVLNERVRSHLEAAYGLETFDRGSLDTTHYLDLAERYVSLLPGFEPQPPSAATLDQAKEQLLSQALAHEFPAAPKFEAEIKLVHLKKVYEQVMPAAQTPDGRVLIEKTMRTLVRQIADPLLLGEMGPDATHFVLGQHWRNHFHRKLAETHSDLTVAQLREWIDDPRPMGLPKEAQNLVIVVFAAQTNRTFTMHEASFEPTLADLRDEYALREQRLPGQKDWELAVERAGSIFGVAVSRLLNTSNVNAMSTEVKKKASAARGPCQKYCQRLRERMAKLGLTPEHTDRWNTASTTLGLLERVHHRDAGNVVDLLATTEVATSEAAMASALARRLSSRETSIRPAGISSRGSVSSRTKDKEPRTRYLPR